MTGYEVAETELNPAQFSVVASCAEGYEGTATVTACGEGGGEYTLGGCAEAPPPSPPAPPPVRLTNAAVTYHDSPPTPSPVRLVNIATHGDS